MAIQNWKWKRSNLTPQLSWNLLQLYHELAEVRMTNSEDVWVWLEETTMVFSTKSVRNLLENNRAPVDLSPLIWKHLVPPSVKCFIWRARLGRIPVKKLLAARGVPIGSEERAMCVGNVETVDHSLLM